MVPTCPSLDFGLVGASSLTSTPTRVVLGTIGGTISTDAIIWTQARGSEFLASYLASYGITLPGYQLTSATVSDDGRTFAVNTIIPSTLAPNAFIITIPTSGTLSVGLLGIALASRRRR